MSDEELEGRLEAALRQMSEEDVRTMAREYPEFFTPEVLKEELARWRELQGKPMRASEPAEVNVALKAAGPRPTRRHARCLVVRSVIGLTGA